MNTNKIRKLNSIQTRIIALQRKKARLQKNLYQIDKDISSECSDNSSNKKYAIVNFIEDEIMEVIPSNWLINETEAKWPTGKPLSYIRTCIKECRDPGKEWSVTKVKLHSYGRNVESSFRKIKYIQEIGAVQFQLSQLEKEKLLGMNDSFTEDALFSVSASMEGNDSEDSNEIPVNESQEPDVIPTQESEEFDIISTNKSKTGVIPINESEENVTAINESEKLEFISVDHIPGSASGNVNYSQMKYELKIQNSSDCNEFENAIKSKLSEAYKNMFMRKELISSHTTKSGEKIYEITVKNLPSLQKGTVNSISHISNIRSESNERNTTRKSEELVSKIVRNATARKALSGISLLKRNMNIRPQITNVRSEANEKKVEECIVNANEKPVSNTVMNGIRKVSARDSLCKGSMNIRSQISNMRCAPYAKKMAKKFIVNSNEKSVSNTVRNGMRKVSSSRFLLHKGHVNSRRQISNIGSGKKVTEEQDEFGSNTVKNETTRKVPSSRNSLKASSEAHNLSQEKNSSKVGGISEDADLITSLKEVCSNLEKFQNVLQQLNEKQTELTNELNEIKKLLPSPESDSNLQDDVSSGANNPKVVSSDKDQDLEKQEKQTDKAFKFAIVEFAGPKPREVEIVCHSWINNRMTYWPAFCTSRTQIHKLLKKEVKPDSSWSTYKINRILYTAEDYAQATRKLATAEDSSDLNSDIEKSRQRKIKRPKRFLSESSDIDDNLSGSSNFMESSSLSNSKKKFTKKRRSLPCVTNKKSYYEKINRRNSSVSETVNCDLTNNVSSTENSNEGNASVSDTANCALRNDYVSQEEIMDQQLEKNTLLKSQTPSCVSSASKKLNNFNIPLRSSVDIEKNEEYLRDKQNLYSMDKTTFQDSLKSHILHVLKSSDHKVEEVCNFLIEKMGAECFEDLKLLKDTDLLPVLKIVQCRKLVLSGFTLSSSNLRIKSGSIINHEVSIQQANRSKEPEFSVQQPTISTEPEFSVQQPTRSTEPDISVQQATRAMEPEFLVQQATRCTEPESLEQQANRSLESEFTVQEEKRFMEPAVLVQHENSSMECEVLVEQENRSMKPEFSLQRKKRFTEPSDWIFNFSLPLERMSSELFNCLNEQKRPAPTYRRELVRIIVDKIIEFDRTPGIKAINYITRNIVGEYPCLMDTLCGQVVLNGNNSLSKQIRNRLENVNRCCRIKGKTNDRAQVNHPKHFSASDNYGCCNWNPLMTEEDKVTQEIERKNLLSYYQKGPVSQDDCYVSNGIEKTFALQRSNINESDFDIKEFKNKWPCLFLKVAMLRHFFMLVRVDLEMKFRDEMQKKGKRIIGLLKTISPGSNKKELSTAIWKIHDESANQEYNNNEFGIMLYLIVGYFGEEIELIFKSTGVTTDQQNVKDIESLPSTPCVLFHGSSIFKAKSFMILIDGVVVNDGLKNYYECFLFFMASYFVFNIKYPKKVAATMEFIQRFIMNINPRRGTKQRIKIKDGINSRVLSLINHMANCERMQI